MLSLKMIIRMTDNVKIICRNLGDREFEFPRGISLKEIYEKIGLNLQYPLMIAHANNKVENLNFQVFRNKIIDFKDISTASGFRAYVRSATMVLAKAIHDIFPEDVLRIEHSVSNGNYCTLNGRETKIPADKIAKIKERMKQIVDSAYPIVSHEEPREKVIEIFSKQGDFDKVALVERLSKPVVQFFSIDNYYDYYFSVLLPSTDYLYLFDLIEYENGMLLLLPDRNDPAKLAEFKNQKKLFQIFDEFSRWNTLIGVENVSDFNTQSDDDRMADLLKVAEALHEKKISQIADSIVVADKKIALISGPSSSGKTTFSKRLMIQLMTSGKKPITLSMDNYFVERDDTPLDEFGKPDYESLYAVDLELFRDQLSRLLRGEEVHIPIFNFETGKKQYKGDRLKLSDNSVLIIEGIHALNPETVKGIDQSQIFKIYVSALTTISLDNHNWISTTDNRLLRRMVRDSKFRSYSAQKTIAMWPSVRRGEEKWIFPYQEQADVMFNSSLIFEFDVLCKHAIPLLQSVPRYSDEYSEAYRLLQFLQYFKPISERNIPPTSLLREFMGGSSFRY